MTLFYLQLQASEPQLAGTPIVVEVIDRKLCLKARRIVPVDVPQHFDLPAGHYGMRMLLPSGQSLTHTIAVDESTAKPYIVDLSGVSTHEWMERTILLKQPSFGRRGTLDQPRYESVWLRLWSRSEGEWKVERWPGPEAVWRPEAVRYWFQTESREQMLQLGGPQIPWMMVSLPAAERLEVTIYPSGDEAPPGLTITVATDNNQVEALLGYLTMGALDHAGLVNERVEPLLFGKPGNPAAAAVSAYYLLRVSSLERLSNWAASLGDLGGWMPDGPVISAWQLIRQQQESPAPSPAPLQAARDRLLDAAQRGIPVYTEGLHLLVAGLKLIDFEAQGRDKEVSNALERMRAYCQAAETGQSTTTFTGSSPSPPSASPIYGIPKELHGLAFLYHVPLARLLDLGMLATGTPVSLQRSRNPTEAHITSQGGLRLPDGREYRDPHEAVVGATDPDAWTQWSVPGEGTLWDLRQRAREGHIGSEELSPVTVDRPKVATRLPRQLSQELPPTPALTRGPGPAHLTVSRLLVRLRQPVVSFVRTGAIRRASRWSIDTARTWHRKRSLVTVFEALSYLGAVLLVVAVVWSVVVMIHGSPVIWKGLNNRCGKASLACGTVSGFGILILVAALASAVFFFYQLHFVKSRVTRIAKKCSYELVQTAELNNADIVGRDELCQVIMEDIRDRDARRPHLVVGGAGTGKTALLVRLTELLAECGAVPVPIRLQHAQDDLDFQAIAWDRFRSMADGQYLSNGRAQKVWRQLCKDDQVVVIADGLEEAVNGSRPYQNREYVIRLAIRQAEKDGLPLVIASRPHAPLRAMEAAIVELEPLSEEAALEYVQPWETGADSRRIHWIVETADAAEAPLYMQITRQLHRSGLMEYVTQARSGRVLDTRSMDRAGLRLRLLDTWMQALIDGHFIPGLALSREERLAVIEQLSMLACKGLRCGRRKVSLEVFEAPAKPSSDSEPASPIIRKVNDQLAKIGQRSLDVPLAAVWGERLQLVEARKDAVRFPDGILQAYLGSLFIIEAMADADFREEALTNAGQEFLSALVIRSRAEAEKNGRDIGGSGSRRVGNWFRELLRDSVSKRPKDAKAVDVYAAMLEIDSVDPAPEQQAIASEIVQDWQKLAEQDPQTLEDAKRNLVGRFGEAARTVSHRRRRTAYPARPAYRQLFEIGCRESSYPLQFAIAQEIGAGGDDALSELEEFPGLGPAGREVSRTDHEMRQDEGETYQRDVMRAWLVPLLVGSATDHKLEATARAWLAQWLEFVCGEDGKTGRGPLSLQIALAQGFKHAANRRHGHPNAHKEARGYLAEQAMTMLRGSRFWFTQLTLVHALTLWELPDGANGRGSSAQSPNYEAVVARWREIAGARQGGRLEGHPFVAEACRLALRALKTGQPERYIWIDESEVVSRVGSYPSMPGSQRNLNLWIPPSIGWAALNRRAQQLVADVLLLLNLADRGDEPQDSERRVKRSNRSDLPPCITRYRPSFNPGLTVGTATSAAPGTFCVDGCAFELCPYPPKGGQPGVEMSEAFCRRQQTLLTSRSLNRKAPWQQMRRGQLIQFWAEMADRARGPRPGSAATEPDRNQ